MCKSEAIDKMSDTWKASYFSICLPAEAEDKSIGALLRHAADSIDSMGDIYVLDALIGYDLDDDLEQEFRMTFYFTAKGDET